VAKEIHHEPKVALTGGEEGLNIINHLINTSKTLLKSRGRLLFEMSQEQTDAIKGMLEGAGFSDIRLFHDDVGLPRAFLAQKKG
jgi:release factor glutamine methyltransferase